MNSPSQSWKQQWALLRRRLLVILLYPVRSLLRFVAWPLLLLGPAVYLASQLTPTTYKYGSTILQAPGIVSMVLLFHIFSICDTLVTDKANGMKTLMLSMGLSRINYYCAMLLYSLICTLPYTLVVTVTSKIYLLDDSIGYAAILALSVLFAIHLDAFMAACVSFITSASYSFLVPVYIFLIDPNIGTLAEKTIDAIGSPNSSLILFMSSASPFEVLRLFAQSYANSHKAADDPDTHLSQPLDLLILAQIFWILVYRLFAYWFEEVCPWQSVSAIRNTFFCFERKRKSFNSEETMLEIANSPSSKYFEQRSHGAYETGIQINHVTKIYNHQAAVNDISFTIYRGETTLLLGHNGAGKSTLMNIILGLLESDSGFVKFKNRHGNVSPAVGVCPQTSILDNDLTVRQHLELFNDIKSVISGSERKHHIIQTMKDVSLDAHASKRPEELSGGMKRKLSLGVAFVGKSDVLILDEPSSGLDPDSRMFVWDAIRRYRSDRTVLLSTQHMEEADYLGDRIAIMSSGRIVCCGSSLFLNRMFGTGYKLRIECKSSERGMIIEHLRSHYFDAIQSAETNTEPNSGHETDPIVDMVLELQTRDRSKDTESELINLLEDLEINGEARGVKSFGLKSSSIEDVMLNTSKYFAPVDTKNSAHLLKRSSSGHIATLTGVRSRSFLSSYDLFEALVIKHTQVLRANWFSVIFLKIIMPCIGVFVVIYAIRNSIGLDAFFQNPSLALVIGHLVYYPTRERASKFKIMQATSGASIWLYWISQTFFDLVWAIIPLISVNILVATLIVRPLVSAWTLHMLFSLALVLFYIASMFQCYCLSNIISNSRSSIGYLFIITASSTALGVAVYIIRLGVFKLGQVWMQSLVTYTGVFILPSDAFSLLIVGMPAECYFYPPQRPICVPMGNSSVLIGFIALCLQVISYVTLLFLIERQSVDIEWYFRIRNICPCLNRSKNSSGGSREVDYDVADETTKARTAINDISTPCTVVAAKLYKSYIKNNNIIEDLSFTVNRGECFGLLGVNGAGKTTTFSMLATEAAPDSGRILVGGHYVDEQLHECRKELGYDPQATPEMSLTPFQALSLMARLRGVAHVEIPMIVNAVMEVLEMSQHAHKYDNELSGGTKRKLALGMALIGNPAILTLDEPTAGVDPLARRGIWQLLKSLRTHNNSSIIISSHAMEECEAICDRITIMARGRLRCIGTFLHLRSKFAKGCTLRVQISRGASVAASQKRPDHHEGRASSSSQQSAVQNMSPAERQSSGSSLATTDKIAEELQQRLTTTIGRSNFRLADKNVNSVTFKIANSRVRRSFLFRMMRDFRTRYSNLSYMINDSSLEDIFISLAEEQRELGL